MATKKLLGKREAVVVGIGGAGNNCVYRIGKSRPKGLRLLAVNTDKRMLEMLSKRIKTLLVGKSLLHGIGANGVPENGAQAAIKDSAAISRAIGRPSTVFLLAGLGGGTGTGATPIIADIARKKGAMVNIVAIYPFTLERVRRANAASALPLLAEGCDSLLIEQNDTMVKLVPNKPMEEAFKRMDMRISRYMRERISEQSKMAK
jgi:cell division protein FtsZ